MSWHRPTARRCSLLAVVVAGLSAVVLFSGVAVAEGPADVDLDDLDGGGGDPYVITNASELQAMNQSLDSDYELGGTVNATNTSDWYAGDGFEPIGNATHPFTGSFDGNGYAIENLTVDRGDENYVGLFGNADQETTIGNVTLQNATINGSAHVGTLVGETDGDVYDVHSNGNVTTELTGGSPTVDGDSDSARVGGLVGLLTESGTVRNSTASVNVTGTNTDTLLRVGGLVGYSFGEIRDSKATGDVEGLNGVGGVVGRNAGHIENGTATGNVTGLSDNVEGTYSIGGLAGYNGPDNSGTGSITLSHATGTVTAVDGNQVGGLIGSNRNTVNESYATGAVEGTTEVGGLVGHNQLGSLRDSYANGTVTGGNPAGGLVGRNDATIETSYAVGDVPDNEGGFVGSDNGGTVTAGYWDREATGEETTADGEGLSTVEMTALVAKDYMEFDFDETWNATARYPRLAWEDAAEPDPYPTAAPGEGEVWLLNDSDTGYYHNYSLDSSGDVQWLGEVVASPGSDDSAQLIEIAAGNTTADYDTLVVGPGAYNLTTHQVNLTTDTGANLTRVFSHDGSDETEILRASGAGFTAYEESMLRVDNPAASNLTIGESGTFDANGDGGFYVESDEGGAEDSPLIGVYDAATRFNLTVTNTTFGMWTNHGDTILLEDSGTAFDLELDLVSHSGALINASAASGLSVRNSTITEENDPRGNGLDGEGISFLKLDAGVLDDVTVDNVTIAGATEANTVDGVIDITSLATDASVTIDDLEIANTSQDAIRVATDIASLSLSELNLTDIGTRGLTLTENVSTVTTTDSKVTNTSATSFFTETTANVSQYNVTGTTITDSGGRGLYLRGDIGNATIKNNTLTDSTLTPIEFDVNTGQSTPFEILNNSINGSGNSNSLVVVRQHAQVNITDNTLLNSSLRGIYLDAADSIIENNRIENSSGSKGIHLAGNAHDALVVNTTIIDSATLGIHVDGANNATIRNTTVETAGDYGIRFNNSAADGELVGSTVANTTKDALKVGSEVVSVADLSLLSGRISADVTDTALNTSATTPDGPKTYEAGGEAVNVTVGGTNGAELDNISLSYDTNSFTIDQRALDLWRYNATGWHRENSTVSTDTQVVTTSVRINDSTVLSTFASNVSVAAADTSVDEGTAGTLDVTATNGTGALLDNVTVEVTDDDGLAGITTGDTATTDDTGVASFGFRDRSSGGYTVKVGWTNDTTVTDTATVTVRSTGGSGSGDGGGGGVRPASGTTVTVGGTTDDSAEGDGETADSGENEASRPDTRVSVSDPEPGQTLVIKGDSAYITTGAADPDEGSENDAPDGSDDSETSGAGGSGDDSSASAGNVRSDRLSVRINTDRDFELSVTTYETDLTRSATGQNARASVGRFASGVAFLDRPTTTHQASAPETVRTAAASFERETSTVSAGYVDIEHTLDPEEITGATFEFSIRRAYLDELGVDADAVTLYHRLGGEWVSRETTLTGTDDTYHRFEGTMPAFSVFTLGTGAPPIGVTDASLSASAVAPGESTTVSATVANRGQATAEETIELTLDGEVIGSETVSLAGGETGEISFAYTPTATGEYALAVGGVSPGLLTVGEAGSQPWWLLVVLLIAVSLIVVLWRRRSD